MTSGDEHRAGVQNSGPFVKSGSVTTKTYSSPGLLAEAFGASIFEPAWWPEDAGEHVYSLTASVVVRYRIWAPTGDGTFVSVIGHVNPGQVTAGLLPDSNWKRLSELEAWDGQVSTSGGQSRALVHREQQSIQLIGFKSQADVVRAVKSLRRVEAPAGTNSIE
ncbi:MAG TPA: hypothetical protein VGC05_05140 [Mycobacterium sp.]